MTTTKLPSGSYRVEAYAGYDPTTGKRFRKSFTGKSLRDLKAKAAIWEAEHKLDHDPGTVGGAIERYISASEGVLSPSTIRSYNAMRRALPIWLLRTPALALSEPLLERFIREADVAPKTTKNRVALLSASLRASGVSMPRVKLPQVPLPELNIPDASIVKKTLDAADGELWICIMLAATAPLRAGEIAALSLDDIEGNRIHVCHSMVYGNDHAWHIKPPKTKSSDRYIDMPPELISAIRDQGYVTNWSPYGIRQRFIRLLRDNDIDHYRFHDLRHFCISELLSQGIPEAYVSERSGHIDHATMQRYIHVLGTRRKEASEKIIRHFSSILS